ncbi:NAD(P)H-binding protein [Nonomuraea sp. NPDC050022]|uniref:NmrA family NAD(P)-binding protein n=1 Tax=unclassified Nonomuraea TaxID=2593643 RepID=UPI0033C5865E
MILVTGSTGLVARPLIELLVAEGAKVRAVSRSPQTAGLPDGVEVVARPDVFDGVSALFLHPRAVASGGVELLDMARRNGVRRVVALSASNVDDDLADQPSRFRGDRNKEAEEAAIGSGLEWVSLRACSFAVNTLHSWGGQIRVGDVVRGPYAKFAEALIHERDLAAVGARALLTDEFAGQRLELTGPHSLTHEETVAIIGEVIGRPLRYQEIPPEAAAQGMISRGFPQPFVEALMARYARGVGQPARVTGEVERVLGRPARTFAEWVADHAAEFGE